VSGTDIFAGTDGGGIFRSTNNGTSWTAVNSGLPRIAYISSLAVSDSNIFAGGDLGVYRTTSRGASWTALNSGSPASDTSVTALAASNGNIFAGLYGMWGGGVFLSTNNGATWIAADIGLPNGFIMSLAVDGNNIFAAFYLGGVFLSSNNGASWSAIDAGLPPNTVVRSLAVGKNDIFAATRSSGVWHRPLSETVSVINPTSRKGMFQQTTFKIFPPNRINRSIIIQCSLSHSEKVTFTMYNISGHEIASLGNKHLESGLHRLPFDIPNVAAGCYIMRMKTAANSFSTFFQVMR
jgi:photosystem II stability/assembly factor-like uncharacterized protein